MRFAPGDSVRLWRRAGARGALEWRFSFGAAELWTSLGATALLSRFFEDPSRSSVAGLRRRVSRFRSVTSRFVRSPFSLRFFESRQLWNNHRAFQICFYLVGLGILSARYMVRERATRTFASFCNSARGSPRRVASSMLESFDAMGDAGTVDSISCVALGETVLASAFDWILTMMMLRDPDRMSRGQKITQ